MSDVDHYLAAAREQITLAEQKREVFKGPCENCRFCKPEGFFRTRAICTSPFVKLAAFNRTGAYDKRRLQECDYQRDTRTTFGPVVCGPNGALFEPR